MIGLHLMQGALALHGNVMSWCLRANPPRQPAAAGDPLPANSNRTV